MKQRPRIYYTGNPKSRTLYPSSHSPTTAVSPTSLSNSLTSDYYACHHDT